MKVKQGCMAIYTHFVCIVAKVTLFSCTCWMYFGGVGINYHLFYAVHHVNNRAGDNKELNIHTGSHRHGHIKGRYQEKVELS